MKNNHYPVVLFLYKRPDSTTRILNLAIKSGVNKVYIFADGPKNNQEKLITNKVKSVIKTFQKNNPKVSFITSFSSKNIGLKTNIVNGLNKVFRNEAAAIILEDDCIPSPDFFLFVKGMLKKYKDNSKIMSVTGTSVGNRIKASYSFSRYQLCWGWGTWARAWKLYDAKLKSFNPKQQSVLLESTWPNPVARWYWKNIFQKIKQNIIKTWDYQWTYAHVLNQGLAVIPSVNLITNIGFDEVATHTKVKSSISGMESLKLKSPLDHPKKISENITTTKAIENKFYLHPIAILGLLKYSLMSFLEKKHEDK